MTYADTFEDGALAMADHMREFVRRRAGSTPNTMIDAIRGKLDELVGCGPPYVSPNRLEAGDTIPMAQPGDPKPDRLLGTPAQVQVESQEPDYGDSDSGSGDPGPPEAPPAEGSDITF